MQSPDCFSVASWLKGASWTTLIMVCWHELQENTVDMGVCVHRRACDAVQMGMVVDPHVSSTVGAATAQQGKSLPDNGQCCPTQQLPTPHPPRPAPPVPHPASAACPPFHSVHFYTPTSAVFSRPVMHHGMWAAHIIPPQQERVQHGGLFARSFLGFHA